MEGKGGGDGRETEDFIGPRLVPISVQYRYYCNFNGTGKAPQGPLQIPKVMSFTADLFLPLQVPVDMNAHERPQVASPGFL
jgi:hypothetical protein